MTDYKPSAPPVGFEEREGGGDSLNPLPPPQPSSQTNPPPYPGQAGHLSHPPLGFIPTDSYSTPPPSYQPVPLYPQYSQYSQYLQNFHHQNPYQPTIVQPGTVPTVIEPAYFNLNKYFLVGAILFNLVFTFFEVANAPTFVRLKFAWASQSDQYHATLIYRVGLVISCLYSLAMLVAILRHQLCLVTTFTGIQILFAVCLVYSYFVFDGGAGLPYTLFSVVVATVALFFLRDLRVVIERKRFRPGNSVGSV